MNVPLIVEFIGIILLPTGLIVSIRLLFDTLKSILWLLSNCNEIYEDNGEFENEFNKRFVYKEERH